MSQTPAVGAPVRVAVADDHTLFREGLRALFDSRADVELVGSAADGAEAVKVAVTARPQVMLMDIRMPDEDGIAVTSRLQVLAPDVAVVMLTMVDDAEQLAEAIRHGAVGYVLKGADEDELLEVVHAAARRELHFGPSAVAHARAMLRAGGAPYAPPLPELSEREREILDLLASGYDVARIAGRLHLSTKSVRNYLTGIPRRLGVPDRESALARARAAGLGRHRLP
ncbi:response regulator transcription factor [Georgenia yuyongxinii]|uniref:Response regulator transcription factor n=1 Tax=Georgenia yuyongxinii TaxID=2589797 RepID=A0A552WWS8_9MICO|nr:response regulator transcription factor [Georgenia yuyongxinii]TRW47252.1 response regulator transcription factor [Georgenia yuyongxinii]